jgi:hypothetical protein
MFGRCAGPIGRDHVESVGHSGVTMIFAPCAAAFRTRTAMLRRLSSVLPMTDGHWMAATRTVSAAMAPSAIIATIMTRMLLFIS